MYTVYFIQDHFNAIDDIVWNTKSILCSAWHINKIREIRIKISLLYHVCSKNKFTYSKHAYMQMHALWSYQTTEQQQVSL